MWCDKFTGKLQDEAKPKPSLQVHRYTARTLWRRRSLSTCMCVSVCYFTLSLSVCVCVCMSRVSQSHSHSHSHSRSLRQLLEFFADYLSPHDINFRWIGIRAVQFAFRFLVLRLARSLACLDNSVRRPPRCHRLNNLSIHKSTPKSGRTRLRACVCVCACVCVLCPQCTSVYTFKWSSIEKVIKII